MYIVDGTINHYYYYFSGSSYLFYTGQLQTHNEHWLVTHRHVISFSVQTAFSATLWLTETLGNKTSKAVEIIIGKDVDLKTTIRYIDTGTFA